MACAKRNGDCARAGAHVDDARIGLTAEALQHCFHQVFGFGPRDQNIGRDLEQQAKELLNAGDVLDRLCRQAALEQAVKLICFRRGEKALGMGKQCCLIPSQHVGQKHFGVASRILRGSGKASASRLQ